MLGKSTKKLEKLGKVSIKKGDTVHVLTGKDKGKEGEVVSVSPKSGSLILHQLNIAKKAVKPHPQKNPQGGIIETPLPIDLSNVRLVCPRCSKPSGVTYSKNPDGKTSRKCRKCGELIDA